MAIDMDKVVESLHPLERKALPHLKSCSSLKELSEKAGLQDVETHRAIQWLENKGMLKLDKNVRERLINFYKIQLTRYF